MQWFFHMEHMEYGCSHLEEPPWTVPRAGPQWRNNFLQFQIAFSVHMILAFTVEVHVDLQCRLLLKATGIFGMVCLKTGGTCRIAGNTNDI